MFVWVLLFVCGAPSGLVFCLSFFFTLASWPTVCPGLHNKECDQQVKGWDSPPLFHSNETPPGVLHASLGHSTQEGHRPVGGSPKEGHTDDQRAGKLR